MTPTQRLSRYLTASVIASPIVAAQVSITPLLSTGQPAPGFPEGALISSLQQPGVLDVLNERGHSLAHGLVSGGGVTSANDQGLWHVAPGSVQLVYREGDLAPGTGPDIVFFSIIRVIGIASDDSILAWVQLGGGGGDSVNDSAFYRFAPGAEPELLFREGDQAPGLAEGTLMTTPRQMTRYRDNQIAWHAVIGGANYIWATTTGGAEFLVGHGDAVPGYPGATLANLSVLPTLGGGGALGFTASVVGGPPGGNTSVCRYHPEAGTSVVMLSGQPAEGIGGDVRYATVGIGFNSGIGEPRAAVSAVVVGTNVNSANNDVRYRLENGAPVLAWREGDPLPELGADVYYSGFAVATPSAYALYVSCQVVGTGIDSTNDQTIWRTNGVTRTLIAREDEPAADMPDDVRYASFGFFFNDYTLITNAAGRLMFVSAMRSDAPPPNPIAVFVTDPIGTVRKALGVGDVVQTATGESRTVQGFVAGGMNERGEVLLALQYTSGQGFGLHRLSVGCPVDGCDLADIDGNCIVDLQDLSGLLAQFGESGPALTSDTDRDGDVDLQDLAAVLAAFGNDCSGG